MEVVGNPQAEQPIFDESRAIVGRHEGHGSRLAALVRFAFYERAKAAYGSIILKKCRPSYETQTKENAPELKFESAFLRLLRTRAFFGEVDPVRCQNMKL
jgi:hypothetical protein